MTRLVNDVTILGTIAWDSTVGRRVADVFLDGVKQRPGSVTQFNVDEGWIERGVRRPDDSGWVFDLDVQDFVLERVSGKVEVVLRYEDAG